MAAPGIGFIVTAEFAGDNTLYGAEHRPEEGLHVAGGVNLSDGVIKGKDIRVREGFHNHPLIDQGLITVYVCLRMYKQKTNVYTYNNVFIYKDCGSELVVSRRASLSKGAETVFLCRVPF